MKLRGKILAGFSMLLLSVLLAIVLILVRLESISQNMARLEAKSPQFDEVIDHVENLEFEVYPDFARATRLMTNLERIQNIFIDSLNSDDIFILDDIIPFEDEFLTVIEAILLETNFTAEKEEVDTLKRAFQSYLSLSKKLIPAFIEGSGAMNVNMSDLTDKLEFLRGGIIEFEQKKERSFFESLNSINEMTRDFKSELFSASGFIYSQVENLKTLIPIGTGIMLGGGLLFALFFIEIKILRPVRNMITMCDEMEKGHLHHRVNVVQNDEIGQMAVTLNRFADFLRNQVVESMNRLANGDLTFTILPHDKDDCIGMALEKVCSDLNLLMSQILGGGGQIASGSALISDSCQALSAGVAEQNESIKHISYSMNEMDKQIRHNAENATKVNVLSKYARGAAIKGSEQIDEMVGAMKEMNEAGQNVIKVIKVIDEIAFQTNLLALNAAVEAARAGNMVVGLLLWQRK